jgi:hypothetical protein
MTDKEYDFFEQYNEVQRQVLEEFATSIKRSKSKKNKGILNDQSWEIAPFSLVNFVWCDYVKHGFVRNEKKLDTVVDIFIRNIMKLRVNMVIGGATPEDPKELLEEAGLTADDYYSFVDFAHHYSDYGHGKLMDLAMQLWKETNAEKRLILCDRILNVVHPSNDLSEYFVSGGRGFLDILASQ